MNSRKIMVVEEKRSKKRSVGNFDSKPHEEPIFFLDRSLGSKIVAEKLTEAGAEVRIHSDYFLENAEDVEWLPKVGQKGWVVLAKDKGISKRFIERKALIEAGVRAFILVSGNLKGAEMAEIIVKAFPAMKEYLATYPGPFIAKVFKDGSVIMYITGKK